MLIKKLTYCLIIFLIEAFDMGSVHDKQMVFAKELLGSGCGRGK